MRGKLENQHLINGKSQSIRMRHISELLMTMEILNNVTMSNIISVSVSLSDLPNLHLNSILVLPLPSLCVRPICQRLFKPASWEPSSNVSTTENLRTKVSYVLDVEKIERHSFT